LSRTIHKVNQQNCCSIVLYFRYNSNVVDVKEDFFPYTIEDIDAIFATTTTKNVDNSRMVSKIQH
jgi:hypothetical protein